MVAAHQNLKGLQMIHFNAVEQYLKEALEELNVSKVQSSQALHGHPLTWH